MSYKKKPKKINPDEVDPSVYYYDEIYDEMKEDERSECGEHGESSKSKEQGSKYIQGLKETAELRKAEKELRKFKKYARDREEAEAEGEFSDKDVFITSAYKEKLREMEKVEAERRRLLELEKGNSMNFIKKQKVTKDTSKPPTADLELPGASNKMDDDTIRGTEVQESTLSDHCDTQNRPTRKKYGTLKERKDYLREFLAKRTVGNVYERAVQRYIERKVLTQR